MIKIPDFVVIFLCLLLCYKVGADNIVLETSFFKIGLNNNGEIDEITDKNSNQNYLANSEVRPLMSILIADQVVLPSNLEIRDKVLVLTFTDFNIKAYIKYESRNRYLTFELVKLTNQKNVDVVIWGPFPTVIQKTIGETVGVVRNNDFAIGIQALNVKTLGGYPTNANDVEPSYDIFSSDNLIDVQDSVAFLYRGQTAKKTDFGSVLQAYTRDRRQERTIPNWGHAEYVVPVYEDGGVIGSKIALFGCPEEEALNTIGEIEIQEGLPHPTLNGEWAKTASSATSSYIITDFGEDNLDQAIQLTKDAGLEYLYHGGPFKTWGHFRLNEKEFPDNWESMKRCVVRARKRGIKLGVHTLSNFITTNDRYVTPIPDKRLSRVGESIITQKIDSDTNEIRIESPRFFNQIENNNLHAVVIGSEIIRYSTVSKNEPWTLLGCIRGAFGTKASAHDKSAKIGKLMDHGYKVFLGNAEISEEMAKRIADLFNETGLRQISFDGLEGNWSTGMGQYARSLFTKYWYDNLSPDLKGTVINDASNPSHYNWHINTRYNWGEPWYAGFRESQTMYRLMNQDFYRRNLLPSMLGWFNMTNQTSLEDTEWLLARAAGFDAGFAFNVNLDVVKENGQSEAIFKAIKCWESARTAGLFSPDQKQRMQNINNEYHLEKYGKGDLLLYPYHIQRFVYSQKLRQPGEPVFGSFNFDNPYSDQPVLFSIIMIAEDHSKGAKVSNLRLEFNHTQTMELSVNMAPSNILKLDSDGMLRLYDANWNLIEELGHHQDLPKLSKGPNKIVVDVQFDGGGTSKLDLEIKTKGPAEKILTASN